MSRAAAWMGRVWVCLDCGRVLRQPPHKRDGYRYHSYLCPSPMVRGWLDIDERARRG